jgi:acyl-[acyl-carrier-protein]-phospholipid O-acyltransferase/long-chain-fatty-acid--[acyl-carrier-protein] ligase
MRTIIYYVVKVLCKILFRSKTIGDHKLKFDGPTIILPNHVSFIDPFLLAPFLPMDTFFVINTEMARKNRFFLKFVNHVTVDPMNPYSIKKLIQVIKEGKPVVIFPEGRISVTGNLMKVYSGIALIANRTNATLYPVILLGPEFSKLSRITKKVRSVWFPNITVYFDDILKLKIDPDRNFKRQKAAISDQILERLISAKAKAKEAKDECQNLFDKLLIEAKVHGMRRVIARDIMGSLTYKKLILNSYVLGFKFVKLFKDDGNVGVMLPNSLAHVVTLFSLSYAGKAPAILNFTSGITNNIECAESVGLKNILTSRTFVEKAKLEYFIKKLSVKFNIIYLEDVKKSLVTLDKLMGLVNYLKRKNASNENSRLILFTSGSESKPKGVVLKHSNIIANSNQISCILDVTHEDKLLNPLPMFHSFGLTAGTFFPIFNGFEVFLYPTPLHYKVIPEISYDYRATILIGTPTFLMGYAKNAHTYDFFSMRYVIAGGEKLKEEVRNAWFNKFGLRIIEGYGTTEAAPVISANYPIFNKLGTVGKLMPGMEARIEAVEGIEDGGKLLVKGPNIMEGYYIHGKGFISQGEWYDTGDVVEMDKDSCITIKSRLKRFAKVSGEMVSLDRVERLAESCFKSEGHAVVYITDSTKGEKIILYTTDKSANKQRLREYFNETGNSMLMMPAKIVILDKLPLLGNGKIDYVKLGSLDFNEIK